MKYNYIIINYGNEIYQYYYKDINKLEYAYFDFGYPYNTLLRLLMKLHFSPKVNRLISLPNKQFWIKRHIKKLKKVYESMQKKYDGICFILFSDCLFMEKYGLNKWIKHYFPGAKVVYYFQDLIEKDQLKINFIRDKNPSVDLIMTYDGKEAQKYNLYQHNLPYSNLNELSSKNALIKYDVAFVGLAKDRLNEIRAAYKILSKKGLKCFFYVVDPQNKQTNILDENFVISNKNMGYLEYLNIINKSKCILEIIQKGSSGNTTRVNEAIEFDKYLLTNNTSLIDNPLYESRYMFVYECLDTFDINKINGQVAYKNKGLLSPDKFLQDVEKELNKRYDK